MLDPDIAYQALTSRDTRFDGVFFVGVTSTGIYSVSYTHLTLPTILLV